MDYHWQTVLPRFLASYCRDHKFRHRRTSSCRAWIFEIQSLEIIKDLKNKIVWRNLTLSNSSPTLWWNHALTNEQKEAIKTHRTRIKRTIKIENGTSATQEVEEEREDTIEVLLYTINKHFDLGSENDIDNQRKIIKNLKCSSMRNFRWHKDMFLFRIGMSNIGKKYSQTSKLYGRTSLQLLQQSSEACPTNFPYNIIWIGYLQWNKHSNQSSEALKSS